jgi:hypothetical protein
MKGVCRGPPNAVRHHGEEKEEVHFKCVWSHPFEALKLYIFRQSAMSVALWNKIDLLLGTFSEQIC